MRKLCSGHISGQIDAQAMGSKVNKVYRLLPRIEKFLRPNEEVNADVKWSITLMHGSFGHTHSFLNLINHFQHSKEILPAARSQSQYNSVAHGRHWTINTMSLKFKTVNEIVTTQGDSGLLWDLFLLVWVGLFSRQKSEKACEGRQGEGLPPKCF